MIINKYSRDREGNPTQGDKEGAIREGGREPGSRSSERAEAGEGPSTVPRVAERPRRMGPEEWTLELAL